jgi:diguanylate cyclase (GGDEF)-like protein/PAS domain S-box-containing protein
MLQSSHQLIAQEARGQTLNHRWKNRRPHLVAWGIAAFAAFLLIVLTQQAVMLHAQESRYSRVVTEAQWLWWQAITCTGLLLGMAALFSWHRAREQASHQALAQANGQMNLALEGGGLGLWTWDLLTQRFEPDSRMWGLLGYAPDELPANTQTFLQLVHPDDVAAVQEALVPVLKGESPRLLLSHRMRHKDGHWVWLMTRGQVVSRDADGRAMRMAGTDVDRSEQVRLAREVEESQELLKNMTDQVPAELFQFKVHPDGRSSFPYVSKHFLDFYGLTMHQVQEDAGRVFAWQHPDDAAVVKASISRTVTDLVPWQQEYRLRLPDGSIHWRSGRAVPHKAADGSVVCYGAIFDITERKLSEEALRVAAVAFESTSAMMISDAQRRVLQVNGAFTSMTGYSLEEAVGKPSELLRSGRHDAAFHKAMEDAIRDHGRWEGEIWNRKRCGEVYLDWLAITAVKDPTGETTHYVSVHTDITLRKHTEDEFRKLAFFDPLTGLPNRRLLMDRLQQMLATRTRNDQLGAVLFLDLDRFKQLNDAHGHDQGDELLIQVAQRLLACVREVDTVARLGGDEFVIALAHLGTDEVQALSGAMAVVSKVRHAMAEPFKLPRSSWTLSASVGVTLLDGTQTQSEEAIRQADEAMYSAKTDGRNAARVWQTAEDTSMALFDSPVTRGQ